MTIFLEYRCKINDRVIFDCEQLIAALNEKETIISDPDPVPVQSERDYLELCKIKFNVRSSVFSSASPYEIIQGWNSLSQYLQLDEASKLDRITEIFLLEYIIKLKRIQPSMFCQVEPDIIDCARLSYWYYLCSKNNNDNTFQHKQKEIKGKLRRGLLTNLEQFKSSYSYKNNEEPFEHIERIQDRDRIRKIAESLPKIKSALPANNQTVKKFNNYMYQWFKEVSSINAELMFAALCSLNGYAVSFVPSGDELHDYDFLINSIPAQVKANIIYRGNVDRSDTYLKDILEIIRMSNEKTLTMEYIKERIVNFIKTNYLSQVRKAIEQKARIILIDATQSSVGFALNKWASENNFDDLSFQKSLSEAFSLNQDEDSVPSVFAAGAHDYNYRLSSLCLKFPVVKIQEGLVLDDSRLDLTNIT